MVETADHRATIYAGIEPNDEDVVAAAERLAGVVHRTPIMTSTSLNQLTGATLFFKCEHLQRTGAFKLRGAYNAIACLPPGTSAVAAHSSGNHAAAVALAGLLHHLPTHIVMPDDVTRTRKAMVTSFGASITYSEPGVAARDAALAEVAAQTGAAIIHPYESPAAIAGHGTAVLELLEDTEDLDLVLVPVGGGGLAAGAILASLAHGRGVRIVGVEPSVKANAAQSLRLGRPLPSSDPDTLADGLRSALGRLPFAIMARSLSAILSVDEYAIIRAMRLIWERLKQVVEPSAAVTLAAILESRRRFAGLRVGIVLTGGNVELGILPWAE